MILPLLLAALASAAEPLPTTVTGLKERYVSAVERPEKLLALDALSRTAPAGTNEVSALYDLFMRFPEAASRKAALDSLALAPRHASLEPLALSCLEQPEPESQFFGVHVADHARTPRTLAALRKLASRKLASVRAEDAVMASERGAWWAQYEALDVLAGWEGEKVLPLLRARVEQSPAVAAVIGRRFWAADWPEILRWAGSTKDAERAREAARQPIEPADARATRAAMLKALTAPALDAEFRHQLALKIGASSDDAEAEALARAHDAAANEPDRLLWAAALFVSGKPAAVPVLVRYARSDPDETRRRGASDQLAAMLGAEKAKALVEDRKEDKK